MLEVTQKFLWRRNEKTKRPAGKQEEMTTLDEPLIPKRPEVIIVFAFNGMLFHCWVTPSNLSPVHNFTTPGSLDLFHWTIQYVLVVHYIQAISIHLLDSTIHLINHYPLDSVSLTQDTESATMCTFKLLINQSLLIF